MPRRKQGQSATGGYLKKKSDSDTELIENESFQNKNDLVFKIKKTNSGIVSNSSFHETVEQQYIDTSKSLNDVVMVSKREVNNNYEFVKEQDENSNSRNLLENTYESNHLPSNSSQTSYLVYSDNLCGKSVLNATSSLKIFKNSSNELALKTPEKKLNILTKNNSSVKVITVNDTLHIKTNRKINNKMIIDSPISETEISNNSFALQTPNLNNSQMSGIQPDVTSNDSKNCLLDSQQISYRISSSITESKCNQIKSSPNSLSNETYQCSLPSSVYGSPASSIEKVLTALQTTNQSNEDVRSSFSQVSFLQEILQKKNIDGNSSQTISKQINSDKSDVICDSTKLNGANVRSKNLDVESSAKNKFKSVPPGKLKLHIPEISCNDDSSSSAMSVDSLKSGKIAKVTSPQILEQHISKIISENAAIVETLDPKWSRRYFKQSSLSGLLPIENDSKKSSYPLKANRADVKLSASVITTDSPKLHSVLVRDADISANSVSKINMHSAKTSLRQSVPPVTGSSTQISNNFFISTADELKGNAVKSLLSLKQGGYSSHKSSVYNFQDFNNQHPQNPEGSIIKDLLLKDKKKEESKFSDIDNLSCCSLIIEGSTNSVNKTSLLKCLRCDSQFSEKHSLDIHLSFCKSSSNHLSPLRNSSERMKQTHTQTVIDLAVDSKPQLSGDFVHRDAGVGEILKKQLLLPLSTSPPLKKRKVSDSDGKISSFSTSFEAISPHRSRSHSVHLVGEVQILDEEKSKKLKIKTSSNPSIDTKMTESVGYSDRNNFPSVLVTIAQPVHNSGGTVLLPNCRTSILAPFVSVSNSLPGGMIKYSKTIKHSPEYPKKLSPNESKLISQSEASLLNVTSSSVTSLPIIKIESNFSSVYSSQSYFDSSPEEIACRSAVGKISPFAVHAGVSQNKSLDSPILALNENSFEGANVGQNDFDRPKSSVLPTFIFTPSSPPCLTSDADVRPSSSSASEPSRKYLAPTRPTSLPLKKNTFTMIGSTLISPETPRPQKTCMQLYLNGHAYTYLGLKCSTRSTYCCIYRPQPMFVLQNTNPKLSMYSNWQVMPAKEELSGFTPGQMISFYYSKQRKERTISTTAKLGEPLIFTHSSYWTYRSTEKSKEKENIDSLGKSDETEMVQKLKQDAESEKPSTIDNTTGNLSFASKSCDISLQSDESNLRPDTDNTLSEDGDVNNSDGDDDDDCLDDGTESLTDSSQPQPPKRVKIFEGGFKSNEDYTYVRGRGRGKYVCEECGIRCKKPSMLKKHIRTHTDLRPYKCKHCSFAFKTKGNLTKHMKSKAHHKKCTELGIIPVPTTTDDSQIDLEALAKQTAKRKTQFSDGEEADDDDDEDETDDTDDECESDASSMIVSTKSRTLTNGHNKMQNSMDLSQTDKNKETESVLQQTEEQEAARSLLHLSAIGEPSQWSTSTGDLTDVASSSEADISSRLEPSLSSPHYSGQSMESVAMSVNASEQWLSTETLGHRPRSYSADIPLGGGKEIFSKFKYLKGTSSSQAKKPKEEEEDSEFASKDQYTRRYSISVAREARKPRIIQPPEWSALGLPTAAPKWPEDQPMDLSISRDLSKYKASYEGGLLRIVTQEELITEQTLQPSLELVNEPYSVKPLPILSPQIVEYELPVDSSSVESPLLPVVEEPTSYSSASRTVYYIQDVPPADAIVKKDTEMSEDPQSPEIDYAACSPSAADESAYYYGQESVARPPVSGDDAQSSSQPQAEFIVPTSSSSMEEGKCVCRICNKIFAKSSHLRLHVNIHYFERPFRCDNCAVSFRTKGHLQKHKRSVSHYNKVNMNLTFGTPTVDNPRPFKCADCKIAFRIHGHLAKHLRSKMHIMKLECLGKLPFGMYAEMERSGVSLNEIDTTDCNNSLESLQVMARKLYQRDPRRMRWQGPEVAPVEGECTASATSPASTLLESVSSSMDPLATILNPSCSTADIIMTTRSIPETEDVKHEPSELNSLRIPPSYSDADSLPQYAVSFSVAANQELSGQRSDVQESDAVSLNRSSTCHLCGKAFKSAKFLQVHLYSDHPNVISSISDNSSSNNATTFTLATVTCDLCGRAYPNQKALQQHLLSHAQPRPFVCEVCDAGFTSSSSLIAHQSTHHVGASQTQTTGTNLVQLK